ncbi:MAG: hypothetical protein JXP34_27140 [Planctomycetes bacterium]|nr:hypothetical protein [Planctomycetota bacterium]
MGRADGPILSMQEVSILRRPRYDVGLEGSLEVGPGDLVAVRVEPQAQRIPLADAAQGLIEPASGRVLFLGKDWTRVTPDEAARCRARIGRVFAGNGWIRNLDVHENITLGARHHTARPVAEILAEAQALAVRFGLAGIPPGRPAAVDRAELRKSEWIRAFLGAPALLILEQPVRHVDPAGVPALLEALGEARARGAAVVWIDDGGPLAEPAIEPARRYRMEGARLLPEKGEA